MSQVTKPPTFDMLKHDHDVLMNGFNNISFDEFCASLKHSIGASKDYCQGVWPQFLSSPLNYIFSRGPDIQGRELLDLAYSKNVAGIARDKRVNEIRNEMELLLYRLEHPTSRDQLVRDMRLSGPVLEALQKR